MSTLGVSVTAVVIWVFSIKRCVVCKGWTVVLHHMSTWKVNFMF